MKSFRYSSRQWRDFLAATSGEILSRFGSLAGAISAPLWTYVPGTRPDDSRVLLVAHSDTVRGRPLPRSRVRIRRGIVDVRGGGVLGADCRAGVATLWRLRGSGHSLLICDLEESGGIGAESASRILGDDLARHSFALEMDRMGTREIVFYPGTHSDAFRAYLGDAFPGYRFGWGSYTDVATICPTVGIAGANVAIGYRGQHTSGETLSLAEWERATRDVARVLARETFPRFVPDSDPWGEWGGWGILGDDTDAPAPVDAPRDAPAFVYGACVACGYVPGAFDSLERCPDCGFLYPFVPVF